MENFPLHNASENGHTDHIKILLENSLDIIETVNSKNSYGDTPLHYASYNNNNECIRILLECGANVNSKNSYGDTPLHYASYNGKNESIKILLESGADYTIKNDEGEIARDVGEEEVRKIFDEYNFETLEIKHPEEYL